MNKCNVINPSTKQSCGGKIISQQILTTHQKQKKNASHLCNNPKCNRFYICLEDGIEFGHHFDRNPKRHNIQEISFA